MRTRSAFAPTALALTILLGTTACSGSEPQADPTPKLPTSSGPTTTSTPSPQPWEVRSRAGVKAFLERYVELLSNAMRTGDTESLLTLTKKCGDCRDLATQIDEVYDAGGRIETDPLQFRGWSLGEDGLKDDDVIATVLYKAPPATWIRQPGADPETFPGGLDEQGVGLRWTGDSWRLTSIFGVG